MLGTAMRRRLAIASLLVAAAGATSVTAIAGGGPHGDHLASGGFTGGPPFGGPDCPSPIDLCANATFTGTVHGPATAVATSFTPTAEPGVATGTADIVIHDPRGDLRCTESIVLNVTPGGDSEEGWICEITGGTGRFANASGHLEAFGGADRNGNLRGRYGGKLTIP